MDFRKNRDVIVSAVAEERKKDALWGWHVKNIGKNVIHIRWGYLDYCGQKEDFTIIVMEEGNDLSLIGSLRGSVDWHDEDMDDLFIWIGDKHWHDAKTVQEGIRKMIAQMARLARVRY